jgi:hypothetical protein
MNRIFLSFSSCLSLFLHQSSFTCEVKQREPYGRELPENLTKTPAQGSELARLSTGRHAIHCVPL